LALKFRSPKVYFSPLKKFLLWLVFDFSGIRATYEKIRPPTEKTKSGDYKAPSTFLLWIVGIYIAFFGVASQRYENSIDKLEARANGIISLSASNTWKSAISRIPSIQNTLIPTPPTLINPSTVFKSMFGKREKNEVIINLLKDIIRDKKKELAGIDLRYVILDDLDLWGADFTGARLDGASFIRTDLYGTTFKNAFLVDSNLEGAGLFGVIFENAKCVNTNFTKIGINKLQERAVVAKKRRKVALKKGGSFFDPDRETIRQNYIKKLRDQNVITGGGYVLNELLIHELLKAQTLYGSIFNKYTLAKLKKKKPSLFKSPFPSSPTLIKIEK
jgi:pentapeptide repeat protein